MSELALGLAKSAVETTVREVQSAIEKEKELKDRVQHYLVFITDEFQMMQSFLNAVDRDKLRNSVLRTWVTQVRELAYDVEDSIEFIVHLDGKRSYCWRRFLASCCLYCPCKVPSVPLDEAVADVKQLRARVADVSLRSKRYRHKLVADSVKPLAAGAGSTLNPSIAGETARRTTQRRPRDLTQLVGKEDSELRVISLWGPGGDHEITSIIREAYDSAEILQNFEYRGRVKLVHPFNPDSLLQSLLIQFNTNPGEDLFANS